SVVRTTLSQPCTHTRTQIHRHTHTHTHRHTHTHIHRHTHTCTHTYTHTHIVPTTLKVCFLTCDMSTLPTVGQTLCASSVVLRLGPSFDKYGASAVQVWQTLTLEDKANPP